MGLSMRKTESISIFDYFWFGSGVFCALLLIAIIIYSFIVALDKMTQAQNEICAQHPGEVIKGEITFSCPETNDSCYKKNSTVGRDSHTCYYGN